MDVVWIEDPKVEYEALQGQVLTEVLTPRQPEPPKAAEAAAPEGSAKRAKGGKGKTLADFAEPAAAPAAGGGAPAAATEPQKPRQAFLAKGQITLTNYMMNQKRFRFFLVMPDNAVFVSADPKPKEVRERYVAWEVPVLKPTEKTTLRFEVGGVGKGEMDDTECFFSGINEVHVVGADPWHGGEE